MEAPTASPSAPEQLAFLLEKRSGLAIGLQTEIGALQAKVQHLYTHAVQQLGKEGNVVKAGDGNERGREKAATTNASGSYVAAADTARAPLAVVRIATAGDAGGAVGGSGGGGGSESESESVGGKSTHAQVERRRRRTTGTRKKKRMLRQSSGCKTRSCALSFPTSTPRR